MSPWCVGRTGTRARTLACGSPPPPPRRSRPRPLRRRCRHRHPASPPESLRAAGAGRGRGAGRERGAGPERRGEQWGPARGDVPGAHLGRARGPQNGERGTGLRGPLSWAGLSWGRRPHPRRTRPFRTPGCACPPRTLGWAGGSSPPRGALPGAGVSVAARRSVLLPHSAPDSSLRRPCLPLPPTGSHAARWRHPPRRGVLRSPASTLGRAPALQKPPEISQFRGRGSGASDPAQSVLPRGPHLSL